MCRFFSLSLVLILNSCSLLPAPRPGAAVTIASWNVENLFDGVDDGTEYPEFDPEKGWTEAQFWNRCETLSRIIRSLVPGGPDVLALEEIENANVTDVLSQRFLPDLGYRWRVTAPSSVIGIRTVILSRFPFVRTGLLFPQSDETGLTLRPIIEAEISLGNRNLVILANHWKSRIPTPAATERYRQAASRMLASRIGDLDVRDDRPFVVAVGDFNTSLTLSQRLEHRSMVSFTSTIPSEGALRIFGHAEDAQKASLPGTVWDPWSEVTTPPGSYWYHDQWDRLDHEFLSGPSLSLRDWHFGQFDVHAFAAQPVPFGVQAPKGISDHFPLVLTLVRT